MNVHVFRSHKNGEPVVLPIVVDIARYTGADDEWRDAIEVGLQLSGSGTVPINGLRLAMQHVVFDVLLDDHVKDIDAHRVELQAILDGAMSERRGARLAAKEPT